MKRHFYSDSIAAFSASSNDTILGILSSNNEFNLEQTQRDAWQHQIVFLKKILSSFDGSIFFEYSIPRMGKRIDVLLIIHNVIFILEFKVGDKTFLQSAVDQVMDYALDLKNFHETSHIHLIAPILIATNADSEIFAVNTTPQNDNILFPIKTNEKDIIDVINAVLQFADGAIIDAEHWMGGRYSPTPTIIEAAMSLYNEHSVAELTKSEAENLSETSNYILDLIEDSKIKNNKAICFVTGVPGAGKTLVGLNIATKSLEKGQGETSVFLSGNGPLVDILQEALTRDKVKREKEKGNRLRKGEVKSQVKVFIQNVHHYRDEYLKDDKAPVDHVAIFDEAQRAWNLAQTADFMKRKKNQPDFNFSEPEFLISCLDRHQDWAVVVCLVGGGQEINKGEGGISEWIDSLNRSFPEWNVHISSRLTDSEYGAGNTIQLLQHRKELVFKDELHLSVSMRSFRAEHLSLLVKNLLDINIEESKRIYQLIQAKYPIVLTRDVATARHWLRAQARGTERYGIVVSSQAQRLKPFAIDVKSPMDPVHWFLDDKDDVRSSYYLEDVATEFHVQGLELDWACVTWDGDFRYSNEGWKSFSFVGNKWQHIHKDERKKYLKNAYRVLLTRARQGMIIVVPEGNAEDPTRNATYYDPTFNYLKHIGFKTI
ncbi:MAG: DUF2075 domain-containing protein [Chitinophagaceae bacterium]|nr:DUF2075 domain-containing protein [Chitinophagaceae bacterium]